MKNEPLNLKEIKKLIEECAKNYEIFGDALIDTTFIDIKNHLKSAVQGLLEDLERAMRVTCDEGEKAHLGYCIYLVKKWFPDVVEVK